MTRGYSSEVRGQAKAETRDRITAAVAKVILDVGAHAFTMQDVAEKAGVSHRTVYRHFATREELLEGLSDSRHAAVLRAGLPAPTEARRQPMRDMVNQRVQFSAPRLDSTFAALSDATRRGVLEQLGCEDASITDLAGKFQMTLAGMQKHVGVLEQAGLVTTAKVGRVRTCKLGPRRLEAETAWLERYRQLWDARFDELERVVEELKRKETSDERKK